MSRPRDERSSIFGPLEAEFIETSLTRLGYFLDPLCKWLRTGAGLDGTKGLFDDRKCEIGTL